MIALQKNCPDPRQAAPWHARFVTMLPCIREQLEYAFRRWDAEAREDAVQEGIANCVVAYAGLHRRGCSEQAHASTLARYAARHIRAGREVACRMNCRDLLSPYARRKNNLSVERLEQWDPCTREWVATLVDNRRTSIPDQVVLRIDVPEWLARLSSRKRAIAQDLAQGDSAGEVSRAHGLSAARISQVRGERYRSWCDFHSPIQSSVATRGCEP